MTTTWRRLSERTGTRLPEAVPYEGVPAHLKAPLGIWLATGCHRAQLNALGLQLRLVLDWTGLGATKADAPAATARQSLLRQCHADDEVFLDVLDALLAMRQSTDRQATLNTMLEFGGSAWKVRSDGQGLERRIDETVQDAVVTAAAAAAGSAGEHLRHAWAEAYGRNPDPVKSYSETIKAVEAAAAPTVTPNDLKATLGTIRRQLRAEPAKWRLVIPKPGAPAGGPIDPVVDLLSVLWEGQTSRHGGVLPTLPETLEAAQAAVHLAATVVQWFAADAVQRVP